MLELYGHHWIDDWSAYVIRQYAITLNCDQAFALTHARFESGFYPWAIGDTHPYQEISVYGRTYSLPYFPHLGAYARSYGMFQVNMAGGLGSDWYPRWWEILNVMKNCDIAIRSLAWHWSIGQNAGRSGYDLFWYASVYAGFPGLVDYNDPGIRARYNYWVELYTNPGGGWATWPPMDAPVGQHPPKPDWVCDVTPAVPEGLYGWCQPAVKYQLWLNPTPAEGGTTLPFAGMREYDAGDIVDIRAIPAVGWKFSHWSGDAQYDLNPIRVTMNRDIGINAHFVQLPSDPIMHMLGITVTPQGKGITTPPAGAHDYLEGTYVGISVVPIAGWEFVRWTGNVTGSETANPTTVYMDAPKWLNAMMKEVGLPDPDPDTYTLAIGANNPDGGSTVPPPGIHNFEDGAEVICHATAYAGYNFLIWSEHLQTAENPVTIWMNQNISLIANFFEDPDHPILPPPPDPIPEIPKGLRRLKNHLRSIQLPWKER